VGIKTSGTSCFNLNASFFGKKDMLCLSVNWKIMKEVPLKYATKWFESITSSEFHRPGPFFFASDLTDVTLLSPLKQIGLNPSSTQVSII